MAARARLANWERALTTAPPSSRPGRRSLLSTPVARASGGRDARSSGRQAGREAAGGRASAGEQDAAVPTTPHSGYHCDRSTRRFFEGWYWRVTLPSDGQSFALIYSIEDPVGNRATAGVGAQVMGPDDGYLLQYSPDVVRFWAEPHSLALGAVFRARSEPEPAPGARAPTGQLAGLMRPLPAEEWDARVEEGFQATQTWHQGRILAREAGAAGDLRSTVDGCRWAFSVRPVAGWGRAGGRQQATAGWLAALPVFEPHWQVLMAHGLASGWIEWGGKRYTFENAAAYAEKNWGGGFPKRWVWVQCNTFEGEEEASVTAVGALRGLLGVPGVEEEVGLIGIHHRGSFYEFLPNNGEVEWEADPWGRWRISACNREHEALVEATCASPGTPLRAPTADLGLAPFCRDSFGGQVRMRVWPCGRRDSPPLLDCRSIGKSCAVEVGGGPWWSTWNVKADMAEPVRLLLGLPLEPLADLLPQQLKPPGL